MPTLFSQNRRVRFGFGHRVWIAALMLLSPAGGLRAQAVIPADREGLLKGQEMDLAAIAEMYSLPSPRQVIALKAELGLTRDQLKRAEAAEKVVASAATAKGEEIVQAEEELAAMFELGTANEKLVRTKVDQIGKARAELRFMHLQAYLRIKQILTPDQLKQYAELKARNREN